MASLQILKGANEGAVVPLPGERLVIGRNPDCGIVIPVTSVSRCHATILRRQGRFYLVDGDGEREPSRNKTYLNNQVVTFAPALLRNHDRIRICDFVAAFLDGDEAHGDEPEDPEGSSTVEATLGNADQSSMQLLQTQPAEKLRGLLDISANLNKTLDLDLLLPKIVESLFGLFRQADRCFLIQAEEGTSRLLPRVVRTRKPHEESTARFSKSIVRRCLDTGQAFLSNDASRDDRVPLSQSVVDFRIRSVMCVPLVGSAGKAFGVLQLDTQDPGKKFTQEDLKLLAGVANQASIALENARLHQEEVVRERMRRDLELAHQVQLSFLPKALPEVAGYEFFAHYQSAQEVGGDYYGFVPLPGGRLAVTLGDVAGKGVSAALLMAKLSSDARYTLLTEPDPGRAINKLNDLLCEYTTQMDRFVTLALAVLDPADHGVTLVNAGHLTPLVFRPRSGELAEAMPKAAAGLPLGVMPGYEFETCRVALGPSDTLLLFTDGVTEAVDVRNAQFGARGVHAALQTAPEPRPRALVQRLVKAVQAHASGREPHDDVTLVCLGRG
jgi:serine phosphatase RsbU (regulator of sigma subunit)/pSer/pThr/pTyr-binding forkhead associated (FHA) protein